MHARRLAESAKQSYSDHSAQHYPDIIADQRAGAEAQTAELNEAIANTRDLTKRQLANIQNAQNQAVLAGRDPRSIQGLDEVVELVRFFEGKEVPVPLPEQEGECIPIRNEPGEVRERYPMVGP